MENISTYFELSKKGINQSELEFIDVKLDDDNELFVDPRLIENNSSPLFRPMANCLYKYFGHLILVISNNQIKKTNDLLSGVFEPKETRLGYGFNPNIGKSAGPKLKTEFIASIQNNPVIKARKINNFSDLIFFIPNFRCDRVSDISTKVLKKFLIEFTQQQCKKLGIPTNTVHQSDILNPDTLKWENNDVELPVYFDGLIDRPIIFVPKSIVSRDKDANSNLRCFFRFARKYILQVNDADLTAKVPRNGKNNSILVKDFDATIKNIKEDLSRWVIKHPVILSDYWEATIEKVKPLTDGEIEQIVYSEKVNKAA